MSWGFIFKNCIKMVAFLPMVAVVPAIADDEPQTFTRVEVFAGEEPEVLHEYTLEQNVSGLDNSLLTGGVIYNTGHVDVAQGLLLRGNSAHAGGAIYSVGESARLTVGNNVSFVQNQTAIGQDAGGALYAMGAETATNVTIGSGVYFNQNISHQKAGAIFLEDANLTIGARSVFEENSSVANGGAIYNWEYLANGTQLKIGERSRFYKNTAGTYGGGIVNYDGNVEIGARADFSENSANEGGAIFNTRYLKGVNDAEFSVLGNSVFSKNRATENGGAISNLDAKLSIGTDNELHYNVAKFGGAISNIATGTDSENHKTNATIGDRVAFEYNTAQNGGGAIYSKNSDLTIGKNSKFYMNKAEQESGGALLVDSDADNEGLSDLITIGEKALFEQNSANLDGGAISASDKFGSISITIGKDSIFTGNTAQRNGGALFVSGATETISSGALFENNSAHVSGGAIYLEDWGSHTGKLTISGASSSKVMFVGNNADTNGGAIYNVGTLSSGLTISNAQFIENTAGNLGGAIYNNSGSKLVLSKENVFSGNKVGSNLNDIYNAGTLTVSDGELTLDGGITGNGTVSFTSTSTLKAKYGITTISGTTVSIASGAKLDLEIVNGTQDGSFKMVTKGASGKFTIEKNYLYDLSMKTSGGIGTILLAKRNVDELQDEGFSSDASKALIAISGVKSTGNEDVDKLFNDISLAGQGGDISTVELATQSIQTEKSPVPQTIMTDIQGMIAGLIAIRMAGPTIGRAGGDVNLTSGGLWVQGMYNKSKLRGSFDGYTRGLALGFDATNDYDFTIGSGYAFDNSDVSSKSRDTDVDSHIIFLYAQYKPNAWYMNTMLNYTMSKYKETGNVLGIMPIKSEYDTSAFGANLMTGYDFVGGITPELGVRYMHVLGDDFVDSFGIKKTIKDANYLTGLFGLKYGYNFFVNRYTFIRPELRSFVKYDFISDVNVSTVTMPGQLAYTLDGDRLSRLGGEFGAALAMNYYGLEISLEYDVDIRKSYTGQTGMLRFRYNF